MTIENLLALVRDRGVQIWVEGHRLRYKAKPEALTPELLEHLRQHKSAIIEFLEDANGSTENEPILARISERVKLPLSFAEERLWFLDQLEPKSTVYNIPFKLRLEGMLDVAALRWSLSEILRRHEVLRTCFESEEGRPVQVIGPVVPLEMPLEDLAFMPEGQREDEALRICKAEAQRSFDLRRDVLLRARLLRLGPTEHLLFLNMHHIVSDGWSLVVLLHELGAHYRAFGEGKVSPLPELAIQYGDYAVWQRKWLQGEVLGKQLSYWRKQLDGAPALLELPTDRPRPVMPSYRGAVLSQALPQAVADGLAELSRQEGVTLFITLLTVFQALLHRYTEQEDVMVGTPFTGRNRKELEGLIGFFVNTLVIRGDLSGDPSFRTLLGRAREVALGAYEHSDVPFDILVKELLPERVMGRSPFSQVRFVLRNVSAEAAELPGLQVSLLLIANEQCKFDLTLYAEERGESLEMVAEYSTDLFDESTIRRMLAHYQTILEMVVSNPDHRLSELPLLAKSDNPRSTVNGDVNLKAGQKPDTRGGETANGIAAPRSILQQQLVQLWEGILNRSPIGIKDDFFELGGHSLLAVQLFSKIEKLTGKMLPLVTLFEARTIEQLANKLEDQSWQPRWTSLVPIKPDGSNPPFFCVHGVGGNILEFEHFSRYIDPDQPLYGIQAQGLDGSRPQHKTVEEMAAHYIKEIQEFEPEGPYYLGGSSFGGRVAYEIARQLMAEGRRIGILVMFDTLAPGYPKWLPGTTEWKKRLSYWRLRFHLHWSNLMVAKGTAKIDYLRAKSSRLWQRRRKVARKVRGMAKEKIGQWLHPRAIREVRKGGHQAREVYEPKSYPVKVTLLRATEHQYGICEDRTNGWSEYALGGVEVHDVPGHHGSIMREPRTKVLVEKLTASLNKAFAEERSRQKCDTSARLHANSPIL